MKRLERLVSRLRSPKWTDFVDPGLVRKQTGIDLYKEHCESCHAVLDRDKRQKSDVMVVLNPIEEGIETPRNIPDDGTDDKVIGTDPDMALDFYNRRLKLGKDGDVVTAQGALGKLLFPVFSKSIVALFTALFEVLSGEDPLGKKPIELRVYKARPLNGVWATAPYLHNGSVPNMMELLKPPAERATAFCVGSQELDVVNMGFKTELTYRGTKPGATAAKKNQCESKGHFWLVTSVPGNSNKGHDNYGVLEDHEILDIIEFIKSE